MTPCRRRARSAHPDLVTSAEVMTAFAARRIDARTAAVVLGLDGVRFRLAWRAFARYERTRPRPFRRF